MNSGRVFRRCLLAASATLGTGLVQTPAFAFPQLQPQTQRPAAAPSVAPAPARAPAPAQTRQQDQGDVEVLTRGPVHEAFAETVAFNPEPGVVVSEMPPESIEELPPEQRPDGDNVTWIPGYFAWDDERSDFLWVSGIWRDIPPGRQWVPGYWAETGQQVQWISGYWADASRTEISYLPEPPASNEVGPNVAAPSPDHTWLPGCWVWHQSRYAWRPGYWTVVPAEWDWIPPHYVWTPRGCVFVDGYYDYAVTRRGTLFCPVYFHGDVYTRRNYRHSPTVVVNLDQFTSHLFWRPSYHHYYFGDYYAADYNDAGFLPWFSLASGDYGYDPFFVRQRRQHGQDRNWLRQVEQEFRYRQDHENSRPPRTLAAQLSQSTSVANSNEIGASLTVLFDELTSKDNAGRRFRRLEESERQQLAQRDQKIREFRQQRQELEVRTSVGADVRSNQTGQTEPEPLKLPTSPILSDIGSKSGAKTKLPQAQEAPPVDPNVEPKPRQPRERGDNSRPSKERRNRPDMKRNRPGENGQPSNVPGADPERGKKGNPLPNRPKTDRPEKNPRKERPETDPKAKPPGPGTPKADPKPDTPRPDMPKVDPKPETPRPETPKVDPKPETPRPETPKVDPKPETPRPETPKVDPKPETPRPETPKVDPKPETPRPETPKVDPKPETPRPETPKVDPKPETPRPEIPRVDPKPEIPRPEIPRVDPKPERPDPVPEPLPVPLS